MFSCLNYSANKVVPLPGVEGKTSELITLPEALLNSICLDSLKNTAIILIEGMGSDAPHRCSVKKDKSGVNDHVYFELVSYETRGLFDDLKTVICNTKQIARTGDVSQGEHSHRRLYNVIRIVKKHINSVNINKVILIGTSHGSLIAHAAFLKIQMDIETDIERTNLSKLHIYTIGSPRYLPKGLLPLPQLLNFYHVDDWISILHLLHGFNVPELKPIKKFMKAKWPLSETGEKNGFHLYDEAKAIVYVNKKNHFPHISCAMLPDKDKDNYFFPFSQKPKTSLFHASSFILYPLMGFKTKLLLYSYSYSKFEPPDYAMCPRDMTGGSKQQIKFKNKVYKIKIDKTLNKYITMKHVKTYLNTIRGKYRYIYNPK
jgi:hypothetical protein